MSDGLELRERVRRVEDQLSRGASQFTVIAESLEDIKTHLRNQDAVIGNTSESISGIVEMWESGVKGVQFACRVAKGWEWLIAQTLSKRGLTLLALGLLVYRVVFNTFPQWTNYIVVLIRFIEGAKL